MTFSLGVMVVSGWILEAVAIAVIIAWLLGLLISGISYLGMTAIIGGKVLAYWCSGVLFGSLALSLVIMLVNR
ncbi:hypothetical protein [Crocosphaera sp.]|uniref:hypothetical protein n=1 Tax=Crocosphaera sp. TaxID=2729996 RepID=UPI003F20E7AA